MARGDARPRARRATPRRATCSAPPASPASWRPSDARADPALPSAAAHQGRGRHRRRTATLPGLARARDRQGHRPDRRRDGGADRGRRSPASPSTTWCKAVERGMRIEGIRLVEKSGGKSGHYRAEGVGRGADAGRRGARPRARRTPRRCRAETVPLAEAHGRVLADDRRGAAHAAARRRLGHGRLCGARRRRRQRAGAAQGGRRGRGRASVRRRGRRRRGRAHLHRRRAAAGRRHHRDPGEHRRATATPSSSRRRAGKGKHVRRAGLDFARGDVLLRAGPPPHRRATSRSPPP